MEGEVFGFCGFFKAVMPVFIQVCAKDSDIKKSSLESCTAL